MQQHDHFIYDEEGEITPIAVRDEDGNPLIENLHRWARFFETANRQVAENFYMGEAIRVSTVFLSLAHIQKDSDEPALFETMIFAADNILQKLLELSEHDDRSIIASVFGGVDIQRRYATKEEALTGHTQLCTFIEVCLAHDWLPQPEASENE